MIILMTSFNSVQKYENRIFHFIDTLKWDFKKKKHKIATSNPSKKHKIATWFTAHILAIEPILFVIIINVAHAKSSFLTMARFSGRTMEPKLENMKRSCFKHDQTKLHYRPLPARKLYCRPKAIHLHTHQPTYAPIHEPPTYLPTYLPTTHPPTYQPPTHPPTYQPPTHLPTNHPPTYLPTTHPHTSQPPAHLTTQPRMQPIHPRFTHPTTHLPTASLRPVYFASFVLSFIQLPLPLSLSYLLATTLPGNSNLA